MPKIAAPAGKGGTYFSTMRGGAEIDAQQAAADKIAELESGYILQQMTDAMNTSLGLPAAKNAAATTAGTNLRNVWKGEQEEYGGGIVPLIMSTLNANQPYVSAGTNLVSEMESWLNHAFEARRQGAMSFGSDAMSAGGSAAGGGGGGCCFIFIEGNRLTGNV